MSFIEVGVVGDRRQEMEGAAQEVAPHPNLRYKRAASTTNMGQ
jgi:hypothetical protein